jgi:hypothetical protein
MPDRLRVSCSQNPFMYNKCKGFAMQSMRRYA